MNLEGEYDAMVGGTGISLRMGRHEMVGARFGFYARAAFVL
ncbi:MAG TPA: hypothetical protein VFM69_08930 [Pricia sp.]|nr:hypothetical protein [Pricia sp.]